MSAQAKNRTGKENAPPRRAGKPESNGDVDMDANDGYGGFSGDDEPSTATLTNSRKQPIPNSKKATSSSSKYLGKKPSISEKPKTSKRAAPIIEEVAVVEESADELDRGFVSCEEGSKRKSVGRAGSSRDAGGKVGSKRVKSQRKEEASDIEGQEDGDVERTRRMSNLSSEVARLKTQLESRIKERDTFSKQLDSILTKKAEPDKAFERMKDATATQATAQDKVIHTLESVNNKLTTRNATLETEIAFLRSKLASGSASGTESAVPGPAFTTSNVSGEADLTEVRKELESAKEKIRAMKDDLKKRDDELALVKEELGAEIKLATDALRIAEKKATALASAAAGTTPAKQPGEVDDQAANDAIIKLYEDLTGLQVTRVKLAPNSSEFKCLHSSNDRSLEFSLHSSAPFIRDASRPGGGHWGPKNLEYRPLSIEKEVDRNFVERLGTFAEGFIIPREQASLFFQQLDLKVSGNGDADD